MTQPHIKFNISSLSKFKPLLHVKILYVVDSALSALYKVAGFVVVETVLGVDTSPLYTVRL